MSPSTLTLASDPQIASLTAERDRLRSSLIELRQLLDLYLRVFAMVNRMPMDRFWAVLTREAAKAGLTPGISQRADAVLLETEEAR